METIELGRTGRRVSRVGLGALPLSYQGRPERGAALRVLARALELGVTLVDTADGYCLHAGEVGHNERLVREALAAAGGPPGVVVATKGGIAFVGARMEPNGRPWYLRRACERSLRALGRDALDLYFLHTPDPGVPLEESVGALARLREEGKVRAVGLSNVSFDQLRRAMEITEVAAVQNHLSPWDRSVEAGGMLDFCREHGVTFLAHSPAGGSGRVRLLRESAALRRAAEEAGATPVELVLAWVLSRSRALGTIPGASRPESVESSVRAAALPLSAAAAAAAEAAFAAL